jgi:signal transduction histidine kinase
VHQQGEAFEEELLNRLAAIRAAAEILDDHEDLSSSDRRQFLLVLKTETRRLQQMITG